MIDECELREILDEFAPGDPSERMYKMAKEFALLRRENEGYRTSERHQYMAVYYDLVQTLNVEPGGSVIEAVERLVEAAKRGEVSESTYAKLRVLAEKATPWDPNDHSPGGPEWHANKDANIAFVRECSPTLVLALLDRLEQATKVYIQDQNGGSLRVLGVVCQKCGHESEITGAVASIKGKL